MDAEGEDQESEGEGTEESTKSSGGAIGSDEQSLMALIGKFITPDGKQLTKSLKPRKTPREKLPKKSSTPNNTKQMKREEYEKRVEKLGGGGGPGTGAGGASNEEAEFARRVAEIGEFFHRMQDYSE